VDAVRILIYGWTFYSERFVKSLPVDSEGLLIAASLTAFLGAYLGSLLAPKIAMKSIRVIVGSLLFILGSAIAIGIA
jgi:uncharacterized protein